jgi:hypothetical protein
MSKLRIKLLGIAAVTTVFAGASFGQIACTAALTTNIPLNVSVRAEGGTELVSDASAGCTNGGAATTGTLTLSLSSPATSKAYAPPVTGVAPATTTYTGNSDAVAFVYAGAEPAILPVPGTGAFAGPYFGSISSGTPNVISFVGNTVAPAATTPSVSLPAGAFYVVFSNVRVNAFGGAGTVSATPGIQYLSGGLTANATGIVAQAVGVIQASLSSALTSSNSLATPAGNPPGTAFYTTCGGNSYGTTAVTSASFIVGVKEIYTGAFKPVGAGALSGENGSYVPAPTGIVGNAGGDQIILTLANIPSSATVYVPQSSTGGGTTLTLTNTTPITSPTGLVFAAGIAANLVSFPVTNGGVTITYTVTGTSTSAFTFNIPVFVGFAASTASAQGAMTVLAEYGPIGTVTGPAASAPLFPPAPVANTLNGSSISLCQTTLLFPFVTNQVGFDTGIVITNAGIDNLGLGGKQSAAVQAAATCTLGFYTTPALTTPTLADPAGVLAAGTTRAFLLSSVQPGFQGYMTVQCPMLYVHGYAFIEYGITTTSGVAEGYLADVLTRTGAGDTATF